MPGHCQYKRVDGVWVLEQACSGQRTGCPPIANFREGPGAPIQKADKESAFLNAFKSAFGADFTFENNDVLNLACETPASDTESIYLRGNTEFKKFKLSEVVGQV